MNILMIGDVYAGLGRKVFEETVYKVIKDHKIDFIVVNGENITHGKSISRTHYEFLKSFDVDVITSGNHIFKKREVIEYIKNTPDLLKPLNMSIYTPGNGSIIVKKNKKRIAVVNLMGKTFMDPCNNPYEAMDLFLTQNKEQFDILLVDFHAEASAEKIAFAWNYDGIITGFVGTHTHVPTADERILPKGTAFITDLGMTGAVNSIIGTQPEPVIFKEKTSLPVKFEPVQSGPTILNGVVITIDDQTNRATKIERIQIKK